MQIEAGVAQTREGARQGTGGGGDQGSGKRAQKTYGEKSELKTGIEQLLGIEDQETQSDSSQEIHGAALAVEIAADHEECQAGGGSNARGLPAGDQRIEPRHHHGQQKRRAFGEKANAQQEKEEGGD